ncbi:4Fe-4S binding protein, partial [Clostridium sp. HCS.1]
MRCVQVCNKVQCLGVWDTTGSGSRTNIGVYKNNRIEDTDCSLCGQCITQCPVGALFVRDDTEKVFDALADPE